jgi:uncharacterized protein (TIRG00374 family)
MSWTSAPHNHAKRVTTAHARHADAPAQVREHPPVHAEGGELTDRQLTHDVAAAIASDPTVDAGDIRVTAHERAITLAGHVSTDAQRQAALRAARRISGVRAVADEIEVRRHGVHLVDDPAPATYARSPSPGPPPAARARRRPTTGSPPSDSTVVSDAPADADDRGGAPQLDRRRVAIAAAWVAVLVAFVAVVLPRLEGAESTARRLSEGRPSWLALGAALEVVSLAAYVALFRGVFAGDDGRIGWRESYQITMAANAAGKLFATAGAGSIALTVWALRESGLDGRTVARRIVCLEVLLYGVYMAALVIGGLGLYTGVLSGPAPTGVTLVPAIFGAAVIAVALSTMWWAKPMERGLRRAAAHASGRAARWLGRAAEAPPAAADGIRAAIALVRAQHGVALFAAAYWAFDVAVLWTGFRAFGPSPPGAVIVMGYFVGWTANVLPIPGGVGGVEGGMIATFLAFGVHGSLTVLAVLAYRTISYYLPVVPGVIAYGQLRDTVARWRAQAQAPTRAVDGASRRA